MEKPNFWTFKDLSVFNADRLPEGTDAVRMAMVETPYFQPVDKDGNPCGEAFNNGWPCPPLCP